MDIPWHPPDRTLRQFATLWLVGSAVLAYRAGVAFDPTVGCLLGGAAGTLGVAGLLWPTSVRPLFLAMTLLTLPIGLLVSLAMLVFVFLAVFTPLAVFFRLVGRDALQRRFEPSRVSYWEPRTVPSDPARYLRTF